SADVFDAAAARSVSEGERDREVRRCLREGDTAQGLYHLTHFGCEFSRFKRYARRQFARVFERSGPLGLFRFRGLRELHGGQPAVVTSRVPVNVFELAVTETCQPLEGLFKRLVVDGVSRAAESDPA